MSRLPLTPFPRLRVFRLLVVLHAQLRVQNVPRNVRRMRRGCIFSQRVQLGRILGRDILFLLDIPT